MKEENNYFRLLQFKPCQRGVAGEGEIQKMFGIPKRDTGRSIPTPVKTKPKEEVEEENETGT